MRPPPIIQRRFRRMPIPSAVENPARPGLWLREFSKSQGSREHTRGVPKARYDIDDSWTAENVCSTVCQVHYAARKSLKCDERGRCPVEYIFRFHNGPPFQVFTSARLWPDVIVKGICFPWKSVVRT